MPSLALEELWENLLVSDIRVGAVDVAPLIGAIVAPLAGAVAVALWIGATAVAVLLACMRVGIVARSWFAIASCMLANSAPLGNAGVEAPWTRNDSEFYLQMCRPI